MKFAVLHAHFYQPNRENPWLAEVDYQPNAHPYHDWNERITNECYGPNTAARILKEDGHISGILNNYSRISFNMGPSLLNWLERHQPLIYNSVIEADKQAQEIFSGHGSSIAQVFSHPLMPRLSRKDKETQIIWGIQSFVRHFSRIPEGMWLSQTAVDTETLEILADKGICFTILSPHQVRAVDESSANADPFQHYRLNLPSGRTIVIFVINEEISHEISFGSLLNSGQHLADRIQNSFPESALESANPLLSLVTDGEIYGHYRHKAEMALSHALNIIERSENVQMTVFGEYLSKFPPTREVVLLEGSSSSGAVVTNPYSSLHQEHDSSSEETLSLESVVFWLNDQLAREYERLSQEILTDPWITRNAYVEIIEELDEQHRLSFLANHLKHTNSREHLVKALLLLEMERNALLMLSSSGFSQNLLGLETLQLLSLAARAVQLCREAGGIDLEGRLIEILARVRHTTQVGISPDLSDTRSIYLSLVQPRKVDLRRVAAHYGITSLLDQEIEFPLLRSFVLEAQEFERLSIGSIRACFGTLVVKSRFTLQEGRYQFATFHFGKNSFYGGIITLSGRSPGKPLIGEFIPLLRAGDITKLIEGLENRFPRATFGFWELFPDAQRTIASLLFEESQQKISKFYEQIYEEHYHMIRVMQRFDAHAPQILRETASHVLNQRLLECLQQQEPDYSSYRSVLEDMKLWNVQVKCDILGLQASKQIAELADLLAHDPLDIECMEKIELLVKHYSEAGALLNLWRPQNVVYQIGQEQLHLRQALAEYGDPHASKWVEYYSKLATQMGVAIT